VVTDRPREWDMGHDGGFFTGNQAGFPSLPARLLRTPVIFSMTAPEYFSHPTSNGGFPSIGSWRNAIDLVGNRTCGREIRSSNTLRGACSRSERPFAIPATTGNLKGVATRVIGKSCRNVGFGFLHQALADHARLTFLPCSTGQRACR